jgi:hypothetical protein
LLPAHRLNAGHSADDVSTVMGGGSSALRKQNATYSGEALASADELF